MFRAVVLAAMVGFGMVTFAGWGGASKDVASPRPRTVLDYFAAKCLFDDVSSGMPAAAANMDCIESVRMSAPYPTYSGKEIERTLEDEARCIASKGLTACRPVSRTGGPARQA